MALPLFIVCHHCKQVVEVQTPRDQKTRQYCPACETQPVVPPRRFLTKHEGQRQGGITSAKIRRASADARLAHLTPRQAHAQGYQAGYNAGKRAHLTTSKA